MSRQTLMYTGVGIRKIVRILQSGVKFRRQFR